MSNIGKQGKIDHSQARELMANVMKLMKRESETGVLSLVLSNYK